MATICTVQLIKEGTQQTLLIPSEFNLSATKFTIREEDGKFILEPIKEQSLIEFLSSLEDLEEDFPDIEDNDLLPLDDINL